MPEVLKSVSQRADNVENSSSNTSADHDFHFSPLPALTELLFKYFPVTESLGYYKPSSPSLHPSPLLRTNNSHEPFPVKNEHQQENPRPVRNPRYTDRSNDNSHYYAGHNFHFSRGRRPRGINREDIRSFAKAYSDFVAKRKNKMTIEEAREFGRTYADFLLRKKEGRGRP